MDKTVICYSNVFIIFAIIKHYAAAMRNDIKKLLKLAITACLLVISFSATAQTRFTHEYRLGNIAFGKSRHNPDSTTFRHLNIGLSNEIDSLNGFQFALLHAVTRRDMHGMNIGTGLALSYRNVNGVQISGLFNGTGRETHGLQLSVVSNYSTMLRGFQLASISNVVTQKMHGVQVSGVANIAYGMKGIQLSSIANVGAGEVLGSQIGGYNYADTLRGLQLGLINVSLYHPTGTQIGIINYTHDTQGRKIGLININPTTKIDALFFAGNTSKTNVALRFRNRSTYSIVGVGTHYMGLDKKFSGAVFYRLGQYFPLSEHWSINGDIGFFHIETFKQNSSDSPERLYSLQANIGADYQITPRLGILGSIGYGDTRQYYHNKEYKNGLVARLGLSIAYNHTSSASSRNPLRRPIVTDSLMALPEIRRPWLAAAEAMGINLMVFSFDKFIMNEDFAQVNIHTIRHNLRTGFVWDNDPFATNLFAHPYHGNLYFNSARSNGLSFWQSLPYSIGGSLTWELFAESEPPAINDWIATSLGGACLGEILGRVSRLVLNDRTHGGNRFLREAAALIINPMQGFNRILRGDAWTVRNEHYMYHDFKQIPIDFSISTGSRYLADNGALFRGEYNPYVNFAFEYGDAFNDSHNLPYDYFCAVVSLGFSANQPLLNTARLMGRLWSAPAFEGKNVTTKIGIYQHFNFYNSEPVKDGSQDTPYRISEAVAVGPGIMSRFETKSVMSRLEQRVFLNVIILGGSKSDYYKVIDRDYNMGSGYSIKSNTLMSFRRMGRFYFDVNYYRIFTWKGWETKDLENVEQLYYNVQGDKSNASLLVLSPAFQINLKGNVYFEIGGSFYSRKTRYKYHPDKSTQTFELKVGLAARI
jgi:hypothetical protein